MRKVLSILLLLVFLLGTANLSVIRHFCGGRVAEVKLSILGDASCGMDTDKGACASNDFCASGTGISKKPCCENELSQISITDDYKPASNKELTNLQSLVIAFHSSNIFTHERGHVTPIRNYKMPPDDIHSVSLSFIQVFLV